MFFPPHFDTSSPDFYPTIVEPLCYPLGHGQSRLDINHILPAAFNNVPITDVESLNLGSRPEVLPNTALDNGDIDGPAFRVAGVAGLRVTRVVDVHISDHELPDENASTFPLPLHNLLKPHQDGLSHRERGRSGRELPLTHPLPSDRSSRHCIVYPCKSHSKNNRILSPVSPLLRSQNV